jgi:hypothetical protein
MVWPRWREALVLVQPATVDRWHRAGFRRCWRRRSRHPGRPCLDSTCRNLIRRLAAENHLWGAPRIHGELLKLGVPVSERTVSRYLQGRPTARSQTWRTFFANHPGDLAFMPPVMPSSAPGDDDVVDASRLSCRPVRSFLDELFTANQSAVVDRPRSRQHRFPGRRLVEDHLCDDRTSARSRTSGPRRCICWCKWPSRRTARGASCMPTSGLCDRQPRETIRSPVARSRSAVLSLCLCVVASSTWP